MSAVEPTQAVPLRPTRDGTLQVATTRVSLDSVLHHFFHGATAEEIALRFPSLRLADVHSCLAYYLNNQESMNDYLAHQRQEGDELESRISKDPTQERGIRQMRERIAARIQAAGSKDF